MSEEEFMETRIVTFLAVKDILRKSGNKWAYNMCFKTPWGFYGTHSVNECVKILLDKYAYCTKCGAKMDEVEQ